MIPALDKGEPLAGVRGVKRRAEMGGAEVFVQFAETHLGLSRVIRHYAISLKRKVEYL